MNGCLTGLVAITAGCASVDTWAAVLIGVVAGWVYMFSSKLIIRLRIDDAVDAIPVHMFGGMWGVIAAGLFSKPDLLARAFALEAHVGWFYEWGRGSGDFTLIGTQLAGVAFILGWVGATTGIFFYVLNFLGALRVSPLEEEAGMDLSRHKGSAYDIKDVNTNVINELNSSRHGGAKYTVADVKKEEAAVPSAPEVEAETEANA
jgi:Amt family ammonium transporter